MADTYNGISYCVKDQGLVDRVTACAAQQGKGGADPVAWAYVNRWVWASSPGWGEAMASAIAAENPAPGADESVVTDGMILATVQPMPG